MDIARLVGLVSIWALLTACAETRISVPPPSSAAPIAPFVCGKLEYAGSNPEWLPRALRDVPSDAHRVLRFEYELEYGIDDESAFDLFNPFLIFGATKSEDAIYVLGVLRISKDGEHIKDYRQQITLDKAKSIFSEGETLTEMRRQGLLRLRDVMDAALQADRSALAAAGFTCEPANGTPREGA